MFGAVQSTPASIRSCASGHYSAFSVKSCLMLSNQPPALIRYCVCVWPLQCLFCKVMLDAVQSTPTSIRSCASGHYSAFFVKSCLMMSNPPPLQSGLVHLAITVPSLSSHAWWCQIHPASIRSCASGHYSAFSVLSSHYWCCPIHPHFNQVLCVWPLQCLLCQVMLDAGQSTPRFNQVLCVWTLQCLLCQVMLDAVQSTPASIRSCAYGH